MYRDNLAPLPNGWRYWAGVTMLACTVPQVHVGAVKTRMSACPGWTVQKNAQKCHRIPSLLCILCLAFFCVSVNSLSSASGRHISMFIHERFNFSASEHIVGGFSIHAVGTPMLPIVSPLSVTVAVCTEAFVNTVIRICILAAISTTSPAP